MRERLFALRAHSRSLTSPFTQKLGHSQNYQFENNALRLKFQVPANSEKRIQYLMLEKEGL